MYENVFMASISLVLSLSLALSVACRGEDLCVCLQAHSCDRSHPVGVHREGGLSIDSGQHLAHLISSTTIRRRYST